jgi:hypothetical protein
MPKPLNIPAAALEALKNAGVDDIAFMTCVDKNGKSHYLKGNGVNDTERAYPFPLNTTVQEISQISLIKHTGSTCITYVSGGVVITYCW